MFRAIQITGIHLAASLLVSMAASPLAAQQQDESRPGSSGSMGTLPPQPPAGPGSSLLDGPSRPALPPLQGRPSQAHVVLNRAIELQRQGDYEGAAPLFLEAQRRQADLSPQKQHELAQFMQDNTQALQARKDATESLRLAEKFLAENRPEEANAKLRRVSLNEQYLLLADRQRYQALFQPFRRTGPGVAGPAGTSASATANPTAAAQPTNPALLARDKVKQARVQLAAYQFEAAEKLASEAEEMHQVYNRGEDTPRDVLRDAAHARSDPKSLLTAARAALGRKDYDRAEQLGQLAGQLRSSWSLQLFGDTPAKVLKDVQTARARESEGPALPLPPREGKTGANGEPGTASVPPAQPQARSASAGTAQSQQTPQKERSMFSWLNPFGSKNKSDAGKPGATPPANASGQEPGATGDLKPFSPTLPAGGLSSNAAPGKPAPPQTPAGLASATPTLAPGKDLPRALVGSITPAPGTAPSNPPGLANLPRARVSAVDAPPGPPSGPVPPAAGQTPVARQVTPTPPATPPTRPLQPPTKIELAQTTPPQAQAGLPAGAHAGVRGPASNPPGGPRPTPPASGGTTSPQQPGPIHDPRLTQVSAKPAPVPAASTPPPPRASLPLPAVPVDETEAARALVAQARLALQQGNLVQAKNFNDQARLKKSNLAWWEDNPNLVAAGIAEKEAFAGVRQASGTSQPGEAAGNATKQDLMSKRKEEAVNLLHKGRTLSNDGKLDEAMQCAIKARGLNVKWGFFEDNPDKLQKDITKARIERDKAESYKVLAEARRLLEASELEAAMRACYRAHTLHGTYSIWDIRDRPSMVLGEIEKAKQKKKLLADAAKANAAQGTALAATGAGQGPGGPPQNPAPAVDPRQQASKFLSDARQALQMGDLVRARYLADHVKKMNVRFNPGEDTPDAVYHDIELAQAGAGGAGRPATPVPPANPAVVQGPPMPAAPVGPAQGPLASVTPAANPTPGAGQPSQPVQPVIPVLPPSVLVNGPPPGSNLPVAPSTRLNGGSGLSQTSGQDPVPGLPDGTIRAGMGPIPSQSAMAQRKIQAQQLLAQARALQKDGKLIEARTLALEAQKIGAPFGPQEDSPELILGQLDGQARMLSDFLLRTGYETATCGKGPEAQRFQNAEKCFLDARQLATAFGQDTQPFEARLTWLTNLRNSQPGIAVAQNTTPPAPQPAPLTRSQENLRDARRDLRAGDTASAKRKAQEAFLDPGAREQALALIRSIDAEVKNQQVLEARRGFDAALKAYYRRDFAHARSILNYVNPQMLDGDRRERLRNIMSTPEMSPRMDNALAQVTGKGVGPGMLLPTQADGGPGRPDNRNPAGPGVPVPPGPFHVGVPGFAQSTDLPKPGILESTQAMRAIKFQQLRQDSLRIQSEAAEKFRMGQTDEALAMLQEHLQTLGDPQSGLDPTQTRLLTRSVESRLDQYKVLKNQQDLMAKTDQARRNGVSERAKKFNHEEARQKEIAKQMKMFNELYAAGKYEEAMTAALKARELDPDSSIAAAAYSIARNQSRIKDAHDRSARSEEANLRALNDADDPADSRVYSSKPFVFNKDPKIWETARNRRPASITNNRRTDKDREIENRLSTPATLNFADTPLKQVIDDLRTFHGINFWVDEVALQQEGINLNQLVSIKLENVQLKSALTLLLRSSRLTYVVKDGVVEITTENEARGKLVTSCYLVADLVIPITDYGRLGTTGLTTSWGSNVPTSTPAMSPSPMEPLMGLWGGTPAGPPAPMYNTNVYGNGNTYGQGYGSGGTGVPIGGGNVPPSQQARVAPPTQTQERMLIDLITRTINPKTWSDLGGPGTIEYFPLTMSLVINQTPDLQEQIQDLLVALRRLQDQEVAVEVKVVSISEDFFEQIGVSFTMNIPTNSAGVAQQVSQGYIPSRLISGITPAGNLTNDLSIPITNNIFANQSLPFFGQGTGVPGYGGITMGLAFLSEIQVFLFMQAAQGDSRTNVMQAPKLTLFNGQTATLTVSESAPFVSNVTATVQNGLVLFTPIVTPLTTGVSLTLQAVISGDRRFVRLSLMPSFSVPVPGPVNLFPIVVPVFPISPIGPGSPSPIVFTQYIHLPVFNTILVGTTVMVPDGGTVVLGGLKLLSEARRNWARRS